MDYYTKSWKTKKCAYMYKYPQSVKFSGNIKYNDFSEIKNMQLENWVGA